MTAEEVMVQNYLCKIMEDVPKLVDTYTPEGVCWSTNVRNGFWSRIGNVDIGLANCKKAEDYNKRIMDSFELDKFGNIKNSYTVATIDCCNREKDIVLRVEDK